MKSEYCILPAFIFFMMFFTGCSGFSCLPEINFVGKNREEVVRIFASNPTKTWGTHIHICTPLKNIPPYSCANNLYFKTADEALADKRLQQAPALRGYFRCVFYRLPKQRIFTKCFLIQTVKLFHKKHLTYRMECKNQIENP